MRTTFFFFFFFAVCVCGGGGGGRGGGGGGGGKVVTALSRILHIYRTDRSSKVVENQRTRGNVRTT